MNPLGRVAICGSISQYNEKESKPGQFFNVMSIFTVYIIEINILNVIQMKQLTVQAFLGWNYIPEWPVAFKEMTQWIQEVSKCMHTNSIVNHLVLFMQGKLKYRETVFEGFDSMCDAFVSLFKGDNIGKVVVKI